MTDQSHFQRAGPAHPQCAARQRLHPRHRRRDRRRLVLSDSHIALAEPVRVEAPAPADFSAIVETGDAGRRQRAGEDRGRSRSPAATCRRASTTSRPSLQEFFRRFQHAPADDEADGNGRQPYHPRRGMSQGSGLLHHRGRLRRHQCPCRRGRAATITVVTDDGTRARRQADRQGRAHRPRPPQGRRATNFNYVNFATETAEGRPVGARRRQSVRPRRHGHGRHHLGRRPRHRLRPLRQLPADRCAGEPRQFRRPDLQCARRGRRREHRDLLALGRQCRHRLRHSGANTVQEVVSDLREDGSVTRGWLGVQIQPVTEDIAESLGIDETEGAIVADAHGRRPRPRRRHQDRRHHHQGERQRRSRARRSCRR